MNPKLNKKNLRKKKSVSLLIPKRGKNETVGGKNESPPTKNIFSCHKLLEVGEQIICCVFSNILNLESDIKSTYLAFAWRK